MEVNNSEDVMDSRDVIARIEELKEIRDDAETDATEHGHQTDTEPFGTEEREELTTLESLASEAEGSPDWQHGETLIRDSYFKEYAQELAEDCGLVDAAATWPTHCIDWEQAARELQMDYTAVEFDGVDYWIRS